MPKFNQPTQPNKPRVPAKKSQALGVPLIIEPKCKVCQSPHRHVIDQMLVGGALTYSEIERQFVFAGIPRRSISSHAQKHLGYEETAIREVIEREAATARRNHEEGVSRLVTKNAYLELALQKAWDALIKDIAIVEPKDAVKVIETLQRFQDQNQEAALDELRVQFNMFMQAVKEVVERDRWEDIVGRTADLLRASGRTVDFDEGGDTEELTPAQLEAQIVDAEVVK